MPRTPRQALAAAAAVVASAGILAGCGTTTPSSGAPDGAGAAGCRAQWQQVADALAGRDQQVDPSDLAPRWTAVLATAQYYATTADGGDCGAALAQQRETVQEIQAWSEQLRSYDMPYRFAALAPVATDYLLADGAVRRGAGATAPSKKQVRTALSTLQDTATLATTDMRAGWDEAVAVDLTDEQAKRRTLRDLAFLAGDSTPYQQCLRALGVLERARAAGS
ncbi:MAG: hypothetical protein ACTHNS_07735 [Marmoricola sp.]